MTEAVKPTPGVYIVDVYTKTILAGPYDGLTMEVDRKMFELSNDGVHSAGQLAYRKFDGENWDHVID